MNEPSTEIREKLSELEHEQWIEWSKSLANLLEKVTGNIKHAEFNKASTELLAKIHSWEKNWKPYAELDEATKDFDRKWADKIIQEVILNLKPREVEWSKSHDGLATGFRKLSDELIEGDYLGSFRGEVNVALNVLHYLKFFEKIVQEKYPQIAEECRQEAYARRNDRYGKLYY